ncbi:hypothetical protein DL764_008862 [Monosporascus ibericus]|uniref:Heterokaryon incompatibility domain-containing protein n=1 Tax=Monosporascus ibericus TaxID=155417 RepID=A0A4Q4SZF4_9PEZI|nr:hypothetical protein DL764_008862 [Monosporascus ibericus]
MASFMHKYTPLDLATDTIRLVCLRKGSFNDDIRCDLWEIQLHPNGVPYEALSYTWGCAEKSAKIFLGGLMAQVTHNLNTALRYLRIEDEDRVLWIDAICIDQDNERERGHQVGQMRRIYENAENVLIWLGQGTNETDFLMDSINQVHGQAKPAGDDWRDSSERWQIALSILGHELGGIYATSSTQQREGLEELLRRPWFRRVWIIQEVACARKASVICGWKSVSAGMFAQIPSLMGMEADHWQAILDVMPGHAREKSWWSQSRDLRTLLVKFRDSEARDPRDSIYALLGISSDACGNDIFRPDYEKRLQEVIQNTISFLLFRKLVDLSVYKFPEWTFPELLQNLDGLPYKVLEWALQMGHNATSMQLLADCEIDVNKKYPSIGAPLSFLAEEGQREVVETILARNDADIDLGFPLAKAAEKGHDAIVSLLLARSDADVNLGSPLAKAAEKGHDAIVGLLLAHNDTDINLGSPLANAAVNGYERVVRLLLENGADRESRHINGRTPLSWAAGNGHKRAVGLLLENGADKESRNIDGRTPLSWAAGGWWCSATMFLLYKGADMESRDNHGRTPLSWAAGQGNVEKVELLLENGADKESRDIDGRTPLSWAAGNWWHDTAKFLLSKGATLESRDNEGRTPLSWAEGKRAERKWAVWDQTFLLITKLLRDRGVKSESEV